MELPLRSKILTLLDEHRIMSLATLRSDDWPHATTVGYLSQGLRLYFMCGRISQKARNLARDNRVSLTIDHDVADPLAIRGLSMAARAIRMDDSERGRGLILELLPKKYPEYAPMMSTVNYTDIAMFEVIPEIISILDYTLGFGHADTVEVAPGDL